MYEEGIQKRLIDGTFNQNIGIEFNTLLLQRAKTLFDWSISLASNYSDWDESLPNPKIYYCDKEKWYGEKINTLFQDAVAFVMFHEFAHLTQNHDSFFFGVKTNQLNNGERSERIQIENESDKVAFEALINSNADNEKLLKGVSILLVYLSSILIVKEVAEIKQPVHPDIDNRIFHCLQQLNFTAEDDNFYCYYLCIFVIRFFLLKHNINHPPCEFETVQEAFNYYLNFLDKFKGES
jgi:hypothetical protein